MAVESRSDSIALSPGQVEFNFLCDSLAKAACKSGGFTRLGAADEDNEMTIPCKLWIEQCAAARGIEDGFGVPKALAYLVGEKFLNFLEAAEFDAEFRAEIPAFAAEIKTIFEPRQLAEYLETARQTEAFDPQVYEDVETIDVEWRMDLRRSAADLLLVERAKDWLLASDYLGGRPAA